MESVARSLRRRVPRWPLLLGMPLLLFVVRGEILAHRGPYWLGHNWDPEYVYLLNSLAIAEGKRPWHVDHPGTPVQAIGALVIRVVGPGHRDGDLAAAVLADPERYILSVNTFLFCLYAAGLAALGLYARRTTGSLGAGLLLQVTPVLSASSLLWLCRVGPETLLLSVDLALAALLLRLERRGLESARTPVAAVFGLTCGLAIGTKATAGTLLAACWVVLPGWRRKAALLSGTALSVLASTLWVRHQYPGILSWLVSLLTHRNLYGMGEVGPPALVEMAGNLADIVRSDFALLLLLLAAFATGLRAWRLRGAAGGVPGSAARRVILALGVSGALNVLVVVATHARSRYLVPSAGLSGLLLWLLVREWGPWLRTRGSPASVPALAVASLLFAAGVADRRYFRRTFRRAEELAGEVSGIRRRIRADYPGCAVVHYLRSSSPAYDFSCYRAPPDRGYGPLLKALFPRDYFYDVETRGYSDWSGSLSLDELRRRHGCVVFWGHPVTRGYEKYAPLPDLRDVFRGRTETLYVPAKP